MTRDILVPIHGGIAVAADLAEGLGAVRLTHLVLEAVQGLDGVQREFRSRPECEGYRYPMLLTLLSYAYARGIYGSEEIETRVRTDGDLRYLCAQEFPDAEVLRQFRRRERAQLSGALRSLLNLALRSSTPNAVLDVAAEAARRMESAAAADSLALDC